jgi:predicted Zn-dependent protease with MMP-like domain
MDTTLGSILRAAGVAAFAVGALLFLMNPPQMSGAVRLGVTVLAAVVFILLTAWLTVGLMGRDGPSEEEMERVIVRSEELARSPALATEATEFELLVADAIDELPAEFQEALEKVPVVVSQRGWEFRAYGHYYGDGIARDNYEDRIILYQDTLERDFGWDPDALREQVVRTLRHELAHHLGWGERGVRELGL